MRPCTQLASRRFPHERQSEPDIPAQNSLEMVMWRCSIAFAAYSFDPTFMGERGALAEHPVLDRIKDRVLVSHSCFRLVRLAGLFSLRLHQNMDHIEGSYSKVSLDGTVNTVLFLTMVLITRIKVYEAICNLG